jgi:hypothetical protein
MWSIWSYTLILIALSVSILVIWIKRKYKKLATKDKKMLEKSLKKMGFFIIILFCMIHVTDSIDAIPTVDSIDKHYPVILPTNSLIQASNSIISSITGKESTDEDLWRLNTMIFLNDNTNLTNITNNSNNSIF